MTAQHVTLDGGWSGLQWVLGDGAANTVTFDLINILDTVEVPIVVVQRDFTISCFNKAAGDVLSLSPSDIAATVLAVRRKQLGIEDWPG